MNSLFLKSEVNLMEGKLKAAIKKYEEIYKLCPRYPRNILFKWGSVLEELGFLKESKLKYEEYLNQNGIELSYKNVVKDVLASDQKLVSLGGDHSVSWPILDAHFDIWDTLDILHIDAHPDLYDNLLDNKLSHASPFARIMETGRANRLVQVGIRTLNSHQREQAEKFGVEIHHMRNLEGLSTMSFSKPVYCSIDIDALDPAYAPGVSHFEPGGLSTRQLIDCINGFKGRLIGADIVEYNPKRDFHNLTAMVAAKILKEVIARIHCDNC